MPSKDGVLRILLCPLLPLLSWVSLWSQAKHQNLPFKKTWSAFHFLSAARGATTSASYRKKRKKLSLPKNNLGFKCPLQRGWNNLSWTLRRQKKVIAWESHSLQQGRRQSFIPDSAEAVTEHFLPVDLRDKRSAPRRPLWARHILFWTVNTHRISASPGCALLLFFSCVSLLPPSMLSVLKAANA